MRENLTRYIDLLFAGAPHAAEIKEEIKQNTLDRYDDLIAQGKSPEAAYQLAISGIGDINEILGTQSQVISAPQNKRSVSKDIAKPLWKKILKAIGICLYIICPVPLFILSELGMGTLGLCGTLAIVAVATAVMVMSTGKEKCKNDLPAETGSPSDPKSELQKAVSGIIGAIGLVIYLLFSFATQAWYITWLVFPIMGAAQGLVKACMDLKEANKHEN